MQETNDKSKYVPARKSGRAFNGAERDAGVIVHAVPAQTGGGFWGGKSLCGTTPGYRGNGWHEATYCVGREQYPSEITCSKCLKKLAKL